MTDTRKLDWIDFAIRDLCEMPGRDSPEDFPEGIICTSAEIRDAIESNLSMYVMVPVAEHDARVSYAEQLQRTATAFLGRAVHCQTAADFATLMDSDELFDLRGSLSKNTQNPLQGTAAQGEGASRNGAVVVATDPSPDRAGSDDNVRTDVAVGGAQDTQAGGDASRMPLSVGRSRPDQTATNSAVLGVGNAGLVLVCPDRDGQCPTPRDCGERGCSYTGAPV